MRFGINVLIIRLVVIGLLAGSLAAQQPELVVGSIDFPERAWGNQELPFEVTNNTDWLKFLVIEAHVGFEGSYVNPHRVTRTNVVLEPGKLAVEVDLVVPSNYGLMTLWLRIYDVVDTLDDLTLGTKIFE